MWEVLTPKWDRIFALDYKSLAFVRIGFAIIIMLDLYVRRADLSTFYTDEGLHPISSAMEWQEKSSISFHYINGNFYFQAFLFVTAFIFAFLMCIGYYTKTFTFLSFWMLCSLHTRNGLILNGGDGMLRNGLFFLMFLPIHKWFSVDAALRKIRAKANQRRKIEGDAEERGAFVFVHSTTKREDSLFVFAFIMQFCFIYWFTYGLKFGWTWKEGHSTLLSLHLDQFASATAVTTRNLLSPATLQSLSHAVLEFELYGPFFVIFPIMTDYFRILAVISFVSMHLSFGTFLGIGFFMYIPCIYAIGFLPAWLWGGVTRLLERCGIAKYKIEICIPKNRGNYSRVWIYVFAEVFLTEEASIMENDSPLDCMIVNKNRRGLQAWCALLSAAPLFCLLGFFLAKWQNQLRPLISKIGKIPISLLGAVQSITGACFPFERKRRVENEPLCISLPGSHSSKHDRFISKKKGARKIIKNAVVLVMLTYCLVWNLSSHLNKSFIDGIFKWPIMVTRLDQWWAMFSPNVPQTSGWYLVEGVTEKGDKVEVLYGRHNVSSRPSLPSKDFPNDRWRKYMTTVSDPKQPVGQMQDFCKWICRSWNWPTGPFAYNNSLKSFEFVYMVHRVLVNGTVTTPTRNVLYRHSCYDNEVPGTI